MNSEKVIEVLKSFVSENKQGLVDQVLSKRTRHVTLVFEEIDKPHNISAVLRTAECMGIQDLHFVKNKNDYTINPIITQGAAKWVSLHHHDKDQNNLKACYDKLRSENYQILATSLHETSQSIYEIDISKKTALVFGTESNGISKEAGELADGYVHIPMDGFTESFNLSVSAAICLTVLKGKLNNIWPNMEIEEQNNIKANWYRSIVREADLILKTKGIEVE